MTRQKTNRLRRWTTIVVIAFAGAILAEAQAIYFGANWHEVLPGRVYRCAQLGPKEMAERLDRYGIRTVVNLRGTCVGFDWYENECRTTSGRAVSQEDVTLSATRLPAPAELRRFLEILDRTEYPLVLHCRQGVDRTGMMSAAALLALTDVTLDEAKRQLSLRYGHIPIGPTRVMNRFLEIYSDWLTASHIRHSREAFRRWACSEYCPDACRGKLELLARPTVVPIGEPLALPVRATNTAVYDWVLRPGTETGIHVRFMVFAPDGRLAQVGRAGQFVRRVVPGEHLDLTLAVAPLYEPGRYHLLADLHDRNLWAFSQFGSEPIEFDFEVTSQ